MMPIINETKLHNSPLIAGAVAVASVESISLKLDGDTYSGTLALRPVLNTVHLDKRLMLIFDTGSQTGICYDVQLFDSKHELLHIIASNRRECILIQCKSVRLLSERDASWSSIFQALT